MKCHDIANLLDSREVLQLTETQQAAVNQHLRGCESCESEWRAVRALWDVSMTETPAPRPDFFTQAVRLATAAGARREARPPRQPSFWQGAGFGAALAASLVAAVMTFFIAAPGTDDIEQRAAITVALNETRDVDVAITSASALAQAQIRVVLTGGVRLAGYADHSELSWQTDLDEGVNRLSLPIVAIDGKGGRVLVEVAHASKHQIFVVDVGVDGVATPVA